ncbi:sigma-70 family RNA polymerase sigma factor [Rheinheimera sp.]|uniref:sigma-70 family RNA polymerase sigma factor n=1 Tax=Rheinheimera sp. TaxID=1869214 RepID=UPI00307E947B
MDSISRTAEARDSCAELELHRATQRGSQDVATLVRLHGQPLYYFLLRQCPADLAADICQQSWLRVMEACHQFEGQSSFKTWLFSIARHLLQDEIRRRQRWRWFHEPVEPEAAEQPELELQLAQEQQRFRRAMAGLPRVQREALLLQLEGFSLMAISDICQVGQETIKSRLRYAKAAMAQQLGVDHE